MVTNKVDFFLIVLIVTFCFGSCKNNVNKTTEIEIESISGGTQEEVINQKNANYILLEEEAIVRDYFKWINFWVDSINKTRTDKIDEYVLVHANPWIIDSLRNTDYYYLKEKGVKSLDPQILRFAEVGGRLSIPDSFEHLALKKYINSLHLDINIPEYLLRIYSDDTVIDSFPIRVGKNEMAYLAMAGKTIDLRTHTGVGTIVRINRTPIFINPKDNKKYKVTKRDDNTVTNLPNIPWIEPELDGLRYGHLIHPTTNIATLRKASSNGCIGLREADAWSVYFHAPLGTRIKIRYDLEVPDSTGKIIMLKDIYPDYTKNSKKYLLKQAAIVLKSGQSICHCGAE